ncbi:hypothetical protein [Streptomyces sp. NPDC051219]|uniref:hypothetical protein n=1 Tax=Streptomyces sp. NPDC051219 TaxID=3155283 RepID=UPI00343F2976
MTQTSAVASGPREGEPRQGLSRATMRDLAWPGFVAAAYTLLQLVLVLPGSVLGWDETVYVSQVSRDAPAAFFSAPRARGITYLVAPVTSLTSSLDALRVYLALMSGLGLLLSLRAWRGLLPSRVIALAGALFAGLWFTVFYGPAAMPNLWVAYGAMIAVGCFLRAARDPSDRAALVGLGAGVALAALMRPSDAFWLAAPLAVAALWVRAWRRPALLLTLAAGAVLGGAEWVVEAYLRYDGLFARLRRASEIQGNLGWNLAFDDQLRGLGGRTLCRPCEGPWRPLTGAWWFLLPLLTAGGVMVAVRARRPAVLLVPMLVGVSLAVPYLLLIGYAAPRFLMPAYALMALPVAVCLTWLAGAVKPRPLVVGMLTLAVAAHLTIQYLVLERVTTRSRVAGVAFEAVAAELKRQGVRPPCIVSGEQAILVAFRVGCASRQTGGHDGSITQPGMTAAARSRPVAMLVSGAAGPPDFARGWRLHPLPDLPGRPNLRAYLSPTAKPAPGAPSGAAGWHNGPKSH